MSDDTCEENDNTCEENAPYCEGCPDFKACNEDQSNYYDKLESSITTALKDGGLW